MKLKRKMVVATIFGVNALVAAIISGAIAFGAHYPGEQGGALGAFISISALALVIFIAVPTAVNLSRTIKLYRIASMLNAVYSIISGSIGVGINFFVSAAVVIVGGVVGYGADAVAGAVIGTLIGAVLGALVIVTCRSQIQEGFHSVVAGLEELRPPSSIPAVPAQ